MCRYADGQMNRGAWGKRHLKDWKLFQEGDLPEKEKKGKETK